MPISSFYKKFVISDPVEAKAFVKLIEDREKYGSKPIPKVNCTKMTKERLRELIDERLGIK